MANQKLSSRYSSSIFQLAKESNKIDDVFADMQLIKNTISSSSELLTLLNSPIINPEKKADILAKIFNGNINEISSNFLNLLVTKGRESNLSEICNTFISDYNEMNKVADITLTTAIPATESIVKEVSDLLTKSGKYNKVSIKQEVDKSIIGGFILKMDDQLLDNSIQRKLQVIRKELV